MNRKIKSTTRAARRGAKAKAKAMRKHYAERQRRIRSERDALKQCRTCGAPAAISERTGLLAKQCKRHLGCDQARKLPVLLAWEVRGDLEYELVPLESIA